MSVSLSLSLSRCLAVSLSLSLSLSLPACVEVEPTLPFPTIATEDTAATNFMIRDTRMAMLVSADKEPITPFISRVRELFTVAGISSILVIGGCGEYFEVADRVIQMDSYLPANVTDRAKAIVAATASSSSLSGDGPAGVAKPPRPLAAVPSRAVAPGSFRADVKVTTRSLTVVNFGDLVLDLTGVEQLVEVGQTRAIADFISKTLHKYLKPGVSLRAALAVLDAAMDDVGVDAVAPGLFGGFSRPRLFDMAAALNRFRRGAFTQLPGGGGGGRGAGAGAGV